MAAVEVESRLPELEVMIRLKSSKGRMIADLIRQITEIPDVYRFQTYLTIPNVQEMGQSPDLAASFAVLQLFSYGMYKTYKENPSSFTVLTDKQLFCLRCLSLASLAKESTHQKISFSTVEAALGFTDYWQVFDFIIEALNYSYVKGKMDEPAGCLIVEDFITRDVDLAAEGKNIRAKLDLFLAACDNTLKATKEEAARIVEQKRQAEIQKRELATKVEHLRGQISNDDVHMGMAEGPVGRQKLDLTGKFFKTRPKNSSKSGGQVKMGRI